MFLPLGLCACAGPRPVLYPNAHLQTVGRTQADQDVADCRRLASEYVKSNRGAQVAKSTGAGAAVGAAVGAATGAVFGRAGRGAAAGAAGGGAGGFARGVIKSGQPSPVYRNFVDHCLRDRGYDVVGWQ